jgi:filamentous hemagglutinin family protein
MNALCYKIVFSKRLGSLVAVGEHTTGQGKAAGTGVRLGVFPESAGTASHGASGNFVGLLKSVFASVALSCVTTGLATAAGPAANTLPTGYSVNSGNVAISSTSSATNAAMTIKQTTDKASINWQSFSIGSGAAVNIQQNSASSVLLNRVVGNDPSQIFGKLTANGQVILINPNGVVFGKGGSVTASAFTASTFGMTEEDFKKGKHKFSRNGSTASVTVEEGATITTTVPGGYVALIASNLNNQGRISTQQGAVVLAAGESVALPAAMTDSVGIPLSSKVRLELAPSTINASVENGGTITTEGGQVLMQAAALSDAVASITHTGIIDTTGAQGGSVTLQADHGIIKATGNIKANSRNTKNKGGDIYIGRDEVTGVLAKATNVSGAKLESQGGFVETSGEWLATTGTRVKAKDWLLDPNNINIVSTGASGQGGYSNATPGVAGPDISYTPTTTSNILASDIEASLNDGTNVKISTGLTGSSGTAAGNITVASNITKTSGAAATLELEANNGITINGGVKISDTSGSPLSVKLTANGDARKADGSLDSNNSYGVSIGANGGIDVYGTVEITSTSKFTGGWDFTRSALAMQAGSILRGRSVTANLTVDLRTQNRVFGAFIQNSAALIARTGDFIMNSTLKNVGTVNGWSANSILLGSGVWPKVTLNAGRDIKLTSKIESTSVATTGGIGLIDVDVTAGRNFVADSTVHNSNTSAIGTGGVMYGFKLAAVGDIQFKANQGTIGTGSLTGGGISGANILIDNTGGNLVNGVFTAGSGSSTATTGPGVYLASGAGNSITASGNLIINGNSTSLLANPGVNVNTGLNGQNISVNGTSSNGNAVITQSSSVITASNTASITGESTGSSVSSSALSLSGKVTATNNVTITGNNSTASNAQTAVYLNNELKSTAGEISINADHAGTGTGFQVHTSGKLTTTNNSITIKTDSANLASAADGSINAGTGTVTIANRTAGTKVDVGGADVMTSGDKTLGLTQTELNKVAAGNTVIGSSTSGDLKVSSAITTLDSNGNVSLIGGGNIDVTINNNLKVGTTGTKNLTIKAINGAVTTKTAAAITAKTLDIAAKSIGTSDNRLNAKVTQLNTSTTGDQFITAADSVTVAARTILDSDGNGNGNIDIKTNNGTLSVGTVNGVDGISTVGTGNVTLEGVTSTDAKNGLTVSKDINAGGSVTLLGTSTTGHGVDIDNAKVSANGPINITGTANEGADLGVIIWHGSQITVNESSKDFGGADAIAIKGQTPTGVTSTTGRNVVINDATLTNNSKNGNTYIYGQNSTVAIDPGAVITNGKNAGSIKIVADHDAKVSATTTSTITQNSDSGITLESKGAGNVQVSKLINNGKGDVVVAAGSALNAGNGAGGQVKTISGNSITQNDGGKTYIYSGSPSDTDKLENLMGSLATLYLSKVGDNAQNAQLNTAYANFATSTLNTIQNGATAQVLFRENTKFDEIQINPTTLTKNAGQVDPSTASFSAAVAAANTDGATLTKASITANKFKISTDAAGIGGTLPTPSNQARTTGTYDYAVTSSIANKVTSSSTAPAAKLVVQASTVIPVPTPVIPTSNTTRVKVPVGSANPFALASAEDLTDDICSANSIENCYCEESAVNKGVDICYEPKAGGNGTAR